MHLVTGISNDVLRKKSIVEREDFYGVPCNMDPEFRLIEAMPGREVRGNHHKINSASIFISINFLPETTFSF